MSNEELGPVTKAALLELESKIIDAVRGIVHDSNETLEKTIKELHEQRFSFIEKEQLRSFKILDAHQNAIDILRENTSKDIQGIRSSLEGELEDLKTKLDTVENVQSACQGSAEGREQLVNSQINKHTLFWTAAAVVSAVLIFVAGIGIASIHEHSGYSEPISISKEK